MKFCVFLAMSFSFLSTTLAYPRLYDRVFFEGIITRNGNASRNTSELALRDYQAETDFFKEYYRQKQYSIFCPTGCGAVQDRWTKRSQLKQRSEVQDFIKNCEMNNGTSESIGVLAGTYDACRTFEIREIVNGDGEKMTYNDEVWVADVPFGVVKAASTLFDSKGNVVRKSYEELSDVTWGTGP